MKNSVVSGMLNTVDRQQDREQQWKVEKYFRENRDSYGKKTEELVPLNN